MPTKASAMFAAVRRNEGRSLRVCEQQQREERQSEREEEADRQSLVSTTGLSAILLAGCRPAVLDVIRPCRAGGGTGGGSDSMCCLCK